MSLLNQYNSADARTGINLAHGVYEAVVMENKDSLLMGRLAVYIPELGGNVDDPQSWKTVRYASPFYGITPYRDNVLNSTPLQTVQTAQEAGSISPSEFRQVEGSMLAGAVDRLANNNQRPGQGQGSAGSQAQGQITSYGMWAVPPDLGVTVLVMFAGGDLNRGFWFACVPTVSHGMVPAIGAPDGKTPMAEFNPIDPQVPVTEDLTSIQRQPYEPLVASLTAQGLAEDPLRGPITSSSFREAPSNVFGISSKSGHSFVMDDGTQDGTSKLIRLRTSGGNQITMHDDTGMIYLTNAGGTGWIELSPSGQIDVFGAAGINLATNGELNLHADKNVNIHAGECVKIVGMKGTKVMGGEELQLHGKKTMIEGVDSLHVHSCLEMMFTSFGDIHMKAFNYFCLKGKCFYWNSCTAKEAEQVPPEEPADVSGYQTTVARAPSKEPYKEHDGGQGAGGGGAAGADGTGRALGAPGSFGGGNVFNGSLEGGNAGVSGWWTPKRQKYAAEYLIKNANLSETGAAGLVARWTLEASGGPTSVNPYSGASGIAQWLGSRKNEAATSGDFDSQLAYAVNELNGSEKKAGNLLRSASNAQEAAEGATVYERAEGYNPSTRRDILTKETADRFNTVSNNIKSSSSVDDSVESNNTPNTSTTTNNFNNNFVRTTNSAGNTSFVRQGSSQFENSQVLQNAVKTNTSSGTATQTATFYPTTSVRTTRAARPSDLGASPGQRITTGTTTQPATIQVYRETTKSTPVQAGPMAMNTGTTTTQTTSKIETIDVSSPAANQFLGRGGAQPVGADPALANVPTPDNSPAQDASSALDQMGGMSPSSDLPAAPGGGGTGCFATGDNCERPVDETGQAGAGEGPLDQSGQSAGDIPSDASDEDIAARTIAGECRGCSVEEQAAIGEVLRNRAKVNGTSVKTEALRYKQFSTWNAGNPNRSYITNLNPSSSTYQSALNAYKSSANTNYSFGATHFYNARTARPTWGSSLTPTKVFGSGHRFGYIRGEYGK